MLSERVLSRRRRLSEMIDDGLSLYTKPKLWPLFSLLALPTVALNLVLLAISTRTGGVAEFVLTVPISFVATSLLGTGALYALDRLDRGYEVSSGEAWSEALRRSGDLLEATFRALVVVLLLCVTIIGIPWAFAKMMSWWFTHEAIMIDKQDGESALSYSQNVVSGRGWATAGRFIVLGLISGMPVLAITTIFRELSSETTTGLVNAALLFVAFPFTWGTTLMVYYDLKLGKEANE